MNFFELPPEEKEKAQKSIEKLQDQIYYSDRYNDGHYEYRHVFLPKGIASFLPRRLMAEQEWRALGVRQSYGWTHYMIHEPEPHLLLFRRNL